MNKQDEVEFRGFCLLGTIIKAYTTVFKKKNPLIDFLAELVCWWACKMYTGDYGTEEEIYNKMIKDDTLDDVTRYAVERFCLAPENEQQIKDRLKVALDLAMDIAAENLYFSTLLYLFVQALPELQGYVYNNQAL